MVVCLILAFGIISHKVERRLQWNMDLTVPERTDSRSFRQKIVSIHPFIHLFSNSVIQMRVMGVLEAIRAVFVAVGGVHPELVAQSTQNVSLYCTVVVSLVAQE